MMAEGIEDPDKGKGMGLGSKQVYGAVRKHTFETSGPVGEFVLRNK